MPELEQKTVSANYLKSLQWGMHSAIVDGEIHHDIPSKSVMVSGESELANYTNIMPIGTWAIEYGAKNIWQLNASREWVKA